MKKILVMALAVLGFVSCSKSDSSDEQQEVSFDKFVGTWTGTREAIAENGSAVAMKDCKTQLEVIFKTDNIGNWVTSEEKCADVPEFFAFLATIKGNTIVDKNSEDPIFYYTFENANRLKVETINYTSYFDTDGYEAEIDKITDTGNLPTPDQIAEIAKKYTKKVKYKILLNRQ